MKRLVSEDQTLIKYVINCPKVWSPICVAKSTREWKQTAQHLIHLSHNDERSKRDCKYRRQIRDEFSPRAVELDAAAAAAAAVSPERTF